MTSDQRGHKKVGFTNMESGDGPLSARFQDGGSQNFLQAAGAPEGTVGAGIPTGLSTPLTALVRLLAFVGKAPC